MQLFVYKQLLWLKNVPDPLQLHKCRRCTSNWKATSYAADGDHLVSSVAVASGSDRWILGTMQCLTETEALIGHAGRWPCGWSFKEILSGRQWLNSTHNQKEMVRQNRTLGLAESQLAWRWILCRNACWYAGSIKTVPSNHPCRPVNWWWRDRYHTYDSIPCIHVSRWT